METVVWIVQILLAVVFLFAGLTKITQPREKLVAGQMAWAEDFTSAQVQEHRRDGGARRVALVIPGAFDVFVGLTPLAAVGLPVALMLGAAATHIRRHERQMVAVNLVLPARWRCSSHSSASARTKRPAAGGRPRGPPPARPPQPVGGGPPKIGCSPDVRGGAAA